MPDKIAAPDFQAAMAAHQAGRWIEAEQGYRKVLALNNHDADAFHMLGIFHHQKGMRSEAESLFRRAIGIREDVNFLCHFGKFLQEENRFSDAEMTYRRALMLQPNLPDAHFNLGILFQISNRLREAETAYRRAVELNPNYADAHYNLGSLLMGEKRLAEAETAFRRALDIQPDAGDVHNKLGLVLQESNRLPQAEASFRQAIACERKDVVAHYNLAGLLKESGRLLAAEAAYRQTIECDPDFAEAHAHLARVLLAQGRYAEAWPLYEYRFDPRLKTLGNTRVPDLSFPRWRGESLAGKSILIWPEQGFGDYIQFVRYMPLLKDHGAARITLGCAWPLRDLLKTVEGVDAVITDLASVVPHDFWAFPLSLPLHFGTTLESIPTARPYLFAPPDRVSRWRNRLPSTGWKVGLAWKGNPNHKNDANRSLSSLTELAPLWNISGVSFISLQKDPAGECPTQLPLAQAIVSLGPDIADLADTAAIVAQLDLVICVDTAVAHIAGAMGKPCWVLLPGYATDWRWLSEQTNSPWYPGTMRLFRNANHGDWHDTVAQLAAALEQWVKEQSGSQNLEQATIQKTHTFTNNIA